MNIPDVQLLYLHDHFEFYLNLLQSLRHLIAPVQLPISINVIRRAGSGIPKRIEIFQCYDHI